MTALIEARNLKKHYPIREGILGRRTAAVRAVDDVSLSIDRGEVLGLVGESGSGKSSLGRTLLMLEAPTTGTINFNGRAISELSGSRLRAIRRHMQMVFQDPFSSLNPRMTIEDTLTMPLRFHEPGLSAAERRQRAAAMIETVGLSQAMMARYPHEFSGGQRQRIGIARALMVGPDFIMADEPVSALDVSVQAQVLNLFSRIKRELGLTLLFVTHDLAVVGHIADRVAVMYLGRIVEIAPTRALFTGPRHPYSEVLLSAVPSPVPGARSRRITMRGEPPSPISPPSGCVFRTRCPHAVSDCAAITPALSEVGPGHFKACIRDDLDLAPAINPDRHMEPAR